MAKIKGVVTPRKVNEAIDAVSTAAGVSVAAGTNGLSSGTVQAALQALATRVKALEDAE
jgi:hypothetical protein